MLQNQRNIGHKDSDSAGAFFDDLGFEEMKQEGSTSRFGNMMKQASARKSGNMSEMGNSIGFEQVFAVPLDDTSTENEENL